MARMQFFTHLPYVRLSQKGAVDAGFKDNGTYWERPATPELIQREINRMALPAAFGNVTSWKIVGPEYFQRPDRQTSES